MLYLKELNHVAKCLKHTLVVMEPKANNAVLNTHQLLVNEKYRQQLMELLANMEKRISMLEKTVNVKNQRK